MFQAIEFIAVVTAATYGILEARAARMDPLGVITVAFAVAFGGVISDVLCNRVPSLFRSSPLYATCSFAGCWIFLGVGKLGLAESITATVGIASIVLIRFAAIYWNITLPELHDGGQS